MTAWNTALWADVAEVPAGPPPGGGKKPSLWDREDFWINSGILAATLLAGAVVVYFVDRWRRREMAERNRVAGDELTGFRGMYERGELTEEEYAKVRQRVASRVKAKVAAATPPGPPAAAKPAPPPDPEDRPAPPLGAPPDDPG